MAIDLDDIIKGGSAGALGYAAKWLLDYYKDSRGTRAREIETALQTLIAGNQQLQTRTAEALKQQDERYAALERRYDECEKDRVELREKIVELTERVDRIDPQDNGAA